MNLNKILGVYSIIKYYQEIATIYKLDKHIKLKRFQDQENNDNNINNDINSIKIFDINNSNNIPSVKSPSPIIKSKFPKVYNKMIIYKSKIITNIQLSLEELYNLFNTSNKNSDIQLFFNIILELIKCGFKIKEFYSLCKIKIPFYIDEKIFYEDFLGIDKQKYIDQLINTNNNNQNIILPYQGNLFIPIENERPLSYKNKFIKNIIEDKNILINNKHNIYFFGEMLYLIRPVINLSLLAMFKNNEIIPFLINLVMDIVIYFSRLELDGKERKIKSNFLLQKVNYLEIKMRNKKYFLYLFREPIYSSFFKPLILNILNILHLPYCIARFIFCILDKYKNYCYIA